jgi:hypothetical protein
VSTPNPPAGQAIPTSHHAEHAAPHGLDGELEWFADRIITEVRALCTPQRLQELATLTRELAAGARDGAEVIAWLAARGL